MSVIESVRFVAMYNNDYKSHILNEKLGADISKNEENYGFKNTIVFICLFNMS